MPSGRKPQRQARLIGPAMHMSRRRITILGRSARQPVDMEPVDMVGERHAQGSVQFKSLTWGALDKFRRCRRIPHSSVTPSGCRAHEDPGSKAALAQMLAAESMIHQTEIYAGINK